METVKFALALLWIKLAEAGYANKASDKGKETYRGISRVFHPDWPGWAVVDAAKSRCGTAKLMTAYLDSNTAIQAAVADFYRREYWSRFGLEDLPCMSGLGVLDCLVNHGHGVELIQDVLNVNYGHRFAEPLKVDNAFGPKTKARLASVLLGNGTDDAAFFEALCGRRERYYAYLATDEGPNDPDKANEPGWDARIDLLRVFVANNCVQANGATV